MAFPDIPDVAGVPALFGAAASGDVEDVVLLLADAVGLFAGSVSPQWGLYQDGEPVVSCDTVVSVGYKEDWNISTYPIEGGAFESYNKVQTPFLVRVKFATGGSAIDKQNFIDSIAAIISTTDLFDLVTPEVTYTDVNPIHQDYDRAAIKGVGLLQIELVCEQVRVTTSSSFTDAPTTSSTGGTDGTSSTSSATGAITRGPDLTPIPNTAIKFGDTQSPSASPQLNAGTVQPVTPTDAQNASFLNDLQSQPFNF